ncbi:serine/threonine-protein kinase [Polyangium aurulentum]|uniref:serine/threonine-protein kinase n=1 Tax=Polyangium aurulentum TaxID=2567896 RepID=UPI0010AE12ED|nr:serine/threonine-protein kinase [Polyangium aurulentum]UQA58449.1 serine/threonine protein kinase [Polyangium aurulentum]
MPAPPRPSTTAPNAAASPPDRPESSVSLARAAVEAPKPPASEEWDVDLGATLSGERFAMPSDPGLADTVRPPPLEKPPPVPPIPRPPPPPSPGADALKRSSSSLPAVTPGSLDPSGGRPSSPSFPPAPVGIEALKRSSSSLQAVKPGSLDPSAMRRSSPGGTQPMFEPSTDHRSSAPPRISSPYDGAFDGHGDRFSSPSPTASSSGPIVYVPGDVIANKYRLVRVIGQGGMGAVWVARNLALDVDVALKLIRRDRATEEAAKRLLTEARAAARLDHPGIVRVFDFGVTEIGDPYLVMELLNGESLGAVLARKKRLAPGVAVQTLLPVAAGLAAAHAKGIVHRDLKPDNVMLASDESGKIVPKVLDFGIARVLRDDVERHVTIAGEVLGSPDYMSPEQARGELNIDHRTDVWTFSVLLYETITGKRPFDGPNYNALIAAIITATPVTTLALGAGDAALWAIIERGLSKDSGARWQSMREMGTALATWAVERSVDNDIAGLSIRNEWIAPRMRRLLTVQPPDMSGAELPGGPTPRAMAMTEPEPSLAASRGGADAEWKNLRSGPSRVQWIALAAVLVLGAVILLGRAMLSGDEDPAGASSATTATPAEAPPPPAPAATQTAAPSAAPQATRPASTGATTKTAPTTARPPRTKAPPVPKNIQF